VSFFEPPEIPDEPEPYTPISPPEWIGPPRNMISFPTGVKLRLLTRSLRDEIGDLMSGRRWMHADRGFGGNLPDEVFRLGVVTEHGRAVDYRPFAGTGGVAGFGYADAGRRGGSGDWEQEYWLWPLPPDGVFEFVCEWPAMHVAETHVAVDPAPIRAAAECAITLWDEPPPGADHPWVY